MDHKSTNKTKENKYKPLNIFFFFEKKSDELMEIKEIISSMTDKFIIKGEFNKPSLLNELSYYFGISDIVRGKINKKETQNLILCYSSFDNSKALLFDFIDKFKEGIVNHDDHPFFIFLNDEKNINYNIKQLIIDINKFQENIDNKRKLDSRNISLENKETIFEKIENIFNYFNENDEKNIDFNSNYNKSYTVNILTIGKRGSGKSSLINRLLGEKKAFAQKNAKTLNTEEYYHRYFPIKFIDSAGFEIGTLKQIENVTNFLEKNNLSYENIFKKIHFIFYLFKNNDKFEDIELEIIKKLFSFNIDIFFIITNMTNKNDEDLSKASFEDILSEKNFSEEEIKKIIDNTFCLDLLDINYSETLSILLLNLVKKIEIYQQSNDYILECINNIYNYNKRSNNNNLFESGEIETPLCDNKNIEEGILVKISQKSPNDLIGIIKETIKNNIFYIDYETDREAKYNLALKIVDSFTSSAFWWGVNPVPILCSYLSKLSRKRMIKEIGEIYEVVVENRLKEKNNKEYQEPYLCSKFPIPLLGNIIDGLDNKHFTLSVGKKIVDEFDKDYAKIDIIDKYYNLATIYKDNFNILKEFPLLFKEKYWFDVNIYQYSKSSLNKIK